MVKTTNGRMMSGGSMAKYGEAVRLYGTTSGSLKSLARRFGVNECSLRDFIRRHFPEAVEGHRRAVERERECKAAGADRGGCLPAEEAPGPYDGSRRAERRAGSGTETTVCGRVQEYGRGRVKEREF